jgi:hypothetical protein
MNWKLLNELFGMGARPEDVEAMQEMQQVPQMEPGLEVDKSLQEEALKKFIQEKLNQQQKFRSDPNKSTGLVVGRGKQL